jgi:DNA adenine methylase
MLNNTKKAKPFLKWVGGKGQLLAQFEALFPKEYNSYFEPFIGGGAVFFSTNPKKAHINDINKTLVQAYTHIKEDVENLITSLKKLESEFLTKDEDARKEFYYSMREKYNSLSMKTLRKVSTSSFSIKLHSTECIEKIQKVDLMYLSGVTRIQKL